MMTRKKSLRLLAILAIGMLVWLQPQGVWAEEWLIKLTYEPTSSDAYRPRLSFNYGAEVYGSEDGQSFRKIQNPILHFSGKKTYYIKGNFTEFTHFYDLPDNDAKVSAVLQNCTQLKKLGFKDSRHPEKIEIKDAPLLEKLILYPRYNYYAELKATNCPKLQKIVERLEVFKSLELTNTGIEMLGEMRELVTLKVNNCSDLTRIDAKQCSKLKTLEAKGCEKLETVKVKSANLTTLDLTRSKVAVLDISDCSNISEIKGIAALPLQTLQAKNCGKLETLGVHSANLTTLDLTSSKVSSLDISSCAKLTSITGFDTLPLRSLTAYNSGLTQITGQASLETLNASSCSDLTRIDAKQCSKLKTLEAKNCGKLATVEARSANLTTLDLTYSKVAVLDISNCTKISEIKGIAELSLETLRANNCSNLTKIESSKLETLEAKNCEKLATVAVKSAQLTTLDLTSSKVSSLDISSCAKLTSITGFDTLPLRTLTANNSGLTQITGKASLETLYANSCSKLTSIDAKSCGKLTTFEAKNCGKLATVEVVSKELTKLDLSGSAITKIDVTGCTGLKTIEFAREQLQTLECSSCTSLSAETLRKLLDGTDAPNLATCTAQGVSLPVSLNVNKSLKNLDLYSAKGLTSLTVQAQSVLEELYLANVKSLTELNVSQAKDLKKLLFGWTDVKRINLEGLEKLEEVYMPSNYPARLLTELLCQLHDRKNLLKGSFKYNFSSSELPLVNGSVARSKNWAIYNIASGTIDVTDQCSSTVGCNDITLPTNPDKVSLELAGSTTVKFKVEKPTILWQSKTSDIAQFYSNQHYSTGEHQIEVKENVYLFTQPNALSEIKIESAGNVKGIELTSVPDLKTLTLKEAGKLQSLNITRQTALTSLIVTKAKDLSSLDLSKNTKLTNLEVKECGLTGSLDFSSHNALTEVNLFNNALSSVRLGNAITEIQVSYNQLTTLDLTPATGLKKLLAYNNRLTEITLAADKSKYEYIDIERNALVAFDLQNAVNLGTLLIHTNPTLSNLNLRGCAKLRELSINDCKAFKEIQKPGEDAWFLDGCNALRKLKVYNTGLNATELTKLYCKLPKLSANAGELRVVDKDNADNLKEAQKSGTKIAVDKGWKVLDKNENPFEGDKNRTCDDLKPHDVPVIELVAEAGQTTVKFKTTAKELWIEDISGNFDYMETTPGQEVVHTLKPQFQSTYKFHGKISSFDINNQDKVQSLKIVKHDVLAELKANDCTGMKNVQLSDIANLEKLSINNSHVKELALATFPALKELSCAKNELTQLNFASNTKLEKVDCSENSGLKTITALKSVGSAPAPLKELKFGGSGLTIDAINALFCLLPERTSDAKGKLYAAKDANDANEKLVPDNCYTSRATKKHWEIFLNDGSVASLGNEASGNHACEPEKVKAIKMDPITIIHGETMQLLPTIEPSYADNPKVKWTVKTGADKVKLYDATPAILEALNVGEATIEGVAEDGGGAKAEVKVTVREKQVETITIEPSIPSPFQIGDKVQFTAKVSPANATYRDITWSVDGGAATIDEATGFFVAKSATTNLVVTAKSSSPEHQKKAEYKVQIKAPDVKGLILSQKELTIKKDGKKYSVYATLDPSSAQFTGTILANTADPVIAVTCNPEYDQYGFIKQPFKIEVEGIIEGRETTVTIKPSAFPAISAELKVKVVTEFVDPTDIELPATLSATVGTPVKIEAKVLPETASNRTILWSLKDAQSAEVLKIDVEGNITPLKGGRAVVVATAAGKTDLKKECTVDVSIDAIPSHVKLMTTLTVAKNEEIPMQLAGTGEIFIKAASQVLQYSLTDAYYPVKVKSASGEIEIYGPLTKLEAKEAGDKITAIKFTSDARLTELNVSGNSISELDVQALIELQKLNCANNKLTKLNVIRLTNLTELYCGNNTIAELDLLANANLEKLSCEGLGLNTLNLTTNARLKELICYGNKFATTTYDEIYCTLPSAGGIMIPAKAKVEASSDPLYQALIASSSHLATQKGWKVCYENKSDIQTTGTKPACQEKPAESITIEPLTVKIGETKPIKYGLQPAGSTSVVTFKSLDTNIATVDDKGNVKGVKAGTVKIMLTTDVPSVNGICDVTVEAGTIELTGITIDPLSLKVGETKPIQYKLQPEGAAATVKFKSLDETIATVDDNGNVTGVKEGKVKIEVTTDVATVKGECDVTVEATTPDPGVAVEDAVFANVLVAPNPFEADLRIVLDGESQGVTYQLISANGAVVRSGNILSNETRVETAELTADIYILRLTSGSGKTKSFTLVKK